MHMELEEFKNGQTIFSQGEIGTKFFFILSGTVGIHIT